jgi:hypothetical protein
MQGWLYYRPVAAGDVGALVAKDQNRDGQPVVNHMVGK